MKEVFILLLAAHCYGDFLLQSKGIANGKKDYRYLLLHTAIHGVTVYVLLQQWTLWLLPLSVMIVHGLIDWVKARIESSPKSFVIDQLAHVLSLAGIAYLFTQCSCLSMGELNIHFANWLIGGAGFCAAVLGTGFFIGEVAARMINDDEELKKELKNGLKGGGEMIGRLERAMIFVLFVVGQPAGIGFLIAAKSILRFEEAKKQKLSEYVLIGSLWSFSLAIAISWLTLKAIQL